jgi:hypothetical protein
MKINEVLPGAPEPPSSLFIFLNWGCLQRLLGVSAKAPRCGGSGVINHSFHEQRSTNRSIWLPLPPPRAGLKGPQPTWTQ